MTKNESNNKSSKTHLAFLPFVYLLDASARGRIVNLATDALPRCSVSHQCCSCANRNAGTPKTTSLQCNARYLHYYLLHLVSLLKLSKNIYIYPAKCHTCVYVSLAVSRGCHRDQCGTSDTTCQSSSLHPETKMDHQNLES